MKKLIAFMLTAAMLAPNAVFAQNEASVATVAPETIAIDPTQEPAQASETEELPTEAPASTAEPEQTAEITKENAEATATPEAQASPTAQPVKKEPEKAVNPSLTSTSVSVDIYIGNHQVELDSSAHFNLFNADGVLVGTDEHWISGDTEHIRLEFTVEPYEMGEKFTLGFVDGFHSLTYYSLTQGPGSLFELETYAMTDESGNIVLGNSFAMDAEPNFERGLNFYYNGELIELSPRGRLVDGTGMMPADCIADALGIMSAYHEEYNSYTMSLGSQQLIFNIDNVYATFLGNDINLSHAPVWIDGSIYIPVRDTLEALGCTIDLWQDADHIDVIAPLSPVVQEYRSRERVNREGITSRTNYLIWVSKSDFTVKVYKGSRYNWECIRTAPCAIGAPGTPTIEGQFEYKYAGGRWDYGSYYVWPTMMFYGGYALHSTLRATGGGMWDDRVGVMISHGCVRMHPVDIDWIYATIPVGTRIYVTP